MSPEKWPIARKLKVNVKVVALGILVICPVDKYRNSKTKKWLLAPKIQIFGSKLHIFVPCGQYEPYRSMFSTRKRCLIGFLIWGYQKFYSISKNCFLASNRPNWAQNWHFWSYMGIFGPYDPIPDQKINANKLPRCFFVIWVPKLLLTPINGQILPKICVFGNFGPNIIILGLFRPMPNQKNNANKVPKCFFLLYSYQNFCFLQ